MIFSSQKILLIGLKDLIEKININSNLQNDIKLHLENDIKVLIEYEKNFTLNKKNTTILFFKILLTKKRMTILIKQMMKMFDKNITRVS